MSPGGDPAHGQRPCSDVAVLESRQRTVILSTNFAAPQEIRQSLYKRFAIAVGLVRSFHTAEGRLTYPRPPLLSPGTCGVETFVLALLYLLRPPWQQMNRSFCRGVLLKWPAESSARKSSSKDWWRRSVERPSGAGSVRRRSVLGGIGAGSFPVILCLWKRQVPSSISTRASGRGSPWGPTILSSPPARRPDSSASPRASFRPARSGKTGSHRARVRAQGRLDLPRSLGCPPR